MLNFKKLACSHEYNYYGMYYERYFNSYAIDFHYNIYALCKCTKCGKEKAKLISTKYFKDEIPDNVLTKEQMYDKVYGEYL